MIKYDRAVGSRRRQSGVCTGAYARFSVHNVVDGEEKGKHIVWGYEGSGTLSPFDRQSLRNNRARLRRAVTVVRSKCFTVN